MQILSKKFGLEGSGSIFINNDEKIYLKIKTIYLKGLLKCSFSIEMQIKTAMMINTKINIK